MENSWQIKCGSSSTPSLAPSSSLEPRDQMNTGYHYYPHVGSDLRSTVLGRMEDPVFSNSLNFSIHRPGCADLGNSFLALLSGPPSLLQCDFQELSYPKASGSCGKLPSSGTGVTANAFGNDIPLISSGLLSENLSNQNPRNGADFCPVVSSRAVLSSNCSGNSVLHDLQGSDLAKAVISHIVPGSEKVKGPYLSGGWHSTTPVNTGKLNSMNVQSSQKMPLEANSSISKQSSTFMSGCPRVFCLDTTGYLLLSNTGLLGIVCFCHCFHMSVSKFCEHSGLCDVNPGDVVHMDSGETIAQWRKLYFQKFRIRVPEDQSEWDWPEGLSVTAGFVKSRVTNPNLCKSSDLSHRVGSSGGLVRSRQPLDRVHFPKNPHTDQKSLVDALQNEKQRNFQDVDNLLLKSSVGTSWRNLHAAVDNQMECPISRCSTMQKLVGTGVDNGCQSISAYIDGIMKNGNPSTSYSTLQNVKDLSKDSDVSKTKNAKDSAIVGRDAASSNIELRLGQPYQPSRTSGNSILPVIGPQLFDKLGNPPKSCSPWQMIHNAANYREEDYRQYHHCAADPFNSSLEREPSRLNLGNHAFGISHAIDAARVENFKCNVAKSSVVSPLMDFNNPANSVHSKAKDNMVNGSEHMMHKALHRSSHAAECDPFSVSWNGGNCLERQLNNSDLDSLRLTDKGKGVGCVADASYVATDAGFGNHKQVPYSVLGGNSESAVNDKSRHLHQLSSVPSNASDARNLFSHVEKDPCLGSSGQGDHVLRSNLPLQGVSMGFPLVTSTSNPENTRALLKQEGTCLSPYLLDENLRLLALRQIMELSKQQHALSSIINQERGKYSSSSNVHHSIVDPSTCQEQRHGPDFTSNQDVSEATMNLLQSAPFRGSDDIKKVPSVTGLYDCCNISTFTPGIPFHPEGISLPSERSDDPIQNEQPSLRFCRSDNNVSRPSEHEICCQRVPYTYYQGKCSCEARTNYLGRNVDPKVGSSPNAFKEQMGTGSGEASMILTSRFAKDPFLLMDTSIALDQSGKLNGKLNKNIVCHASQWRDVPTKVKGVCDATVVARLANVFDQREHDGCQVGDASAKYFNGAMQIADSLKDQENSNVSSGCSAPAVTQASIEVNNIDFSTVDAGDTGDVSNHIVDEGSGIDKCWSSDDALGSERSAEFLGSSWNIKLRKEGSSHIINNQSRSLLDELKLIDSLTWKKSRNQIHGRHPIHTGPAISGKSNSSQKTESGLKMGKRKKAIKLKMLSASFLSAGPSLLPYENPTCVATAELPTCSSKDGQGMCHTSGACLIQPNSKSRLSSAKTSSRKRGAREDDYQTELNYDTDFGKNPEVSARKKLRKDFASDASRQFRIQEPTHEEAEKTEKYNSVGCINISSSPQVHVCFGKARPVVSGKYGEISCGKDVSKPAKIVPLSRILKTASRCTLPKSCKPRLTSMRELKKTNSTLIDLSCAKLTGLKNEEDNGSHNVAVCDKMNRDSSMEETYKAWCSDKQFAKKLSILEKERDDKSEKDRSILDSNIPAQLKLKCKEIRKRSIYELTIKGKKSSSDTIPFTKIPDCTPEMKVPKILKNAEDSNHDLHRVCSNKSIQEHRCLSISNSDAFCCVCGSSNQDDINCLLECGRCLIRVHQACYGVSKVPKGRWFCRPCRTSSKDIVCVLCGYGGGAMTRALRSRTVVKGILKAWNADTDCRNKKMISSAESLQKEPSVLHSSGSVLEGNSFCLVQPVNIKSSAIAVRKMDVERQLDVQKDSLCCVSNLKAHNSITAGLLDSTVKQWVHMVCGLWTPKTRCPNVDTMTAFDVSGASHPRANVVCSICNRPGGSCIECRVVGCHIQFHPWCAHQKGLLQSEIEGVANENVGFYGRCVLHATYATSESDCDPINSEIGCQGEKELTCSRTEGYKGRKQDDHQCDLYGKSKGKGGCLVPQEQLNAWIHINGQKPCTPGLPKLAISDIEYDCRKEYARYKQAKGWKHLVVYKSGIHALGLYTSRFISRGEMVVEYVGEIVGLRVADKRENEYQSGRKLQYKSACYFFRIDKEHIIDATRKGGIARFVNHSCLPNCVAKVISVRTEKKVVFFAERDIFPGEEITYDYHFNHEDEGKKIPCFCSSKNCRRYLN